MKIVVIFLALFAATGAINPAAIYRSKCSEGASYWCQSATHADECGAVEYCIQNEWRGKLVEESLACSDCEAFINGVRNVLKQTSVQTEIIDGVKQACVVMESLSGICQTLVETVGAEVLQKLVTELSSDEVCKVLQFCQEKTSLQTNVNDDELCTLCKDGMSDASSFLSNITIQQDIENILLQFCPLLSEVFPNCFQVVQDDIPIVFQFLAAYLNPDTCSEIGLCPGTLELQNLLVQLKKLKNREGIDLCSTCKSTVSTIDSMLNDAAIQNAIILGLDNLCSNFGPAAPVCVFAVQKYTKEIISAIVTYMNPDSFCQEFRFCSSGQNALLIGDSCTDCKTFIGDIDGLLTNQTVQNMIIAGVDDICAEFGDFADQCKSYVDLYGYIVFDFLASQLSPQEVCADISFCPSTLKKTTKKLALLADPCTDCKAFFGDVQSLLLNQTVENMITTDLMDVCSYFGAFADQCKSYVSQYAPLVYSLIASQLEASVDDSETCTLCQSVVGAVETYISSQSNQNLIIQELDSLVCANLPSFLSIQCKALVKSYTPIIINLALTYFKPLTLCTEIKMCPGSSSLNVKADPQFCSDCKAFLADIQALVSNQTFEAEVLTQLEGLCVNFGSFEAECKLLIQTYGPTAFALILSELDPTTDCTAMGLCPAGSAPIILHSKTDPQFCSDCKNFIADIVALISNQTFENEILAEVESLCSMAGSFQAECVLLVKTYGPAAFAYLESELDPTTVCTDVGLCPGNLTSVRSFQRAIALPAVKPMATLHAARPIPRQKTTSKAKETIPKVTDVTCDFCKTVVGAFLSYFDSNETEQEFLDAIETVCEVFGENSTTAQECRNYISTYGSIIFELFLNDLTPAEVCAELGECTSLMDSKPMKHLKEVLSKLPKVDTFCTLCEIGIGELDTILSSNKSKAEITQEVEKLLCGNLPSPINTQCMSFMSIYGDVLVQLLIDQLEPSTFCQDLGLCDAHKQEFQPKMKPLETDSNCILCEFIVAELDKYIEENSTETEIRAAVLAVCNDLPETVRSECDALVEEYGEDIINYLVSYKPSAMCSALGLCNTESKMKPLETDSNCILCEFIVAELDKYIEENSTEAEIRSAVLAVCNDLPETVRSECDALVEEYGEDIINYLVSYKPSAMCSALGLCSADAKIVMMKKMKVEDKQSCILCEYVMSEIQNLLSENSTEEEIQTALDDVCTYFPTHLQEECTDFVNQYTVLLLSYLTQGLNPETFCTTIGECDSAKLKVKKPLDSEQCILCEFIMSELDTFLKENSTEAEIKAALEEVCDHLPTTVRAACEVFVSTYEPELIEKLLNMSAEQVCTDLQLCDSGYKTLLGSIECDLCQTAIREFMIAIQEPSVTKDIVAVINETCPLLPEDLKEQCLSYVDQYGDLVTQFIAQFFDPITSCTLLEACPYPDNSPRPSKRLLGQNECTRGPGYWCASVENAKQCNMVEHCKRHVWN